MSVDEEGARPGRPAGRPSTAAAGQLEEDLLDAALGVFLAGGFQAASMEAIARAAGVTKRTLYRRAPDKQALFREVVGRHAQRAGAPALRRIQGETLEERLKVASDVMLAWFLQPASLALYRTIIAEAGRHPDLGRLAEAPFREAAEAIAAILADGDARSPEQVELGAQLFLRLITAEPLDKAIQAIEPPGTSPEKRARAHAAVDFFLVGWRNW
ncbi:TetR/AcrR family transcriptional regulator [Sphingomonas sp. PL-96]|uniref:TetR/AcrR family transcriptional regulator n=1 Tax=Sphingomonas sp. PL-96 TaxID=2887201 RepID=UPI001E2F9D47|nr:TetR/AcrR family transcriptional regulator [Sphingomonas sp. PL-96]MCC2978041.1 TetR/AcrR family transcriptional regulator [Sphingomonas sp. PL-96]